MILTKNNNSGYSRNTVFTLGKVVVVASLLAILHTISRTKFSSHQTIKRKYLMIVAHPDDEALWAGEFLVENGPETHVVVTSGKSRKRERSIRQEEFETVAKILHYSPEYLLGIDKFQYQKSLKRSIQRRIQQLICSQSWEKIITHGPEGEYGHPGHHAVYDAVSEAVQQCCENSDKLHVFQSTAPPSDVSLEETDWSETKIKALKAYDSQIGVVLHTFLGWKEIIIPIKDYDYQIASKTCLTKNIRSKDINYCRIHRYINAAETTTREQRRQLEREFHLFYDLDQEAIIGQSGFKNKGAGSC